jgi:hypothetical protein
MVVCLTRSRSVCYRTSTVRELPSALAVVTDVHHYTELSFIDEFRWVSSLHYLKNGWENAILHWCMVQAGLPSLHYYCAVVLHSCILLTPVGHFSHHEYHCCQLTRQSSCVSNFYCTFKVFIWLSIVKLSCSLEIMYLTYAWRQSVPLKTI